MSRLYIKDKSNGAACTGIVIRKNGFYVNIVKNKDTLMGFIKENVPVGRFSKKGDRLILQAEPGYKLESSRDMEGNTLNAVDVAYGLGYTFEQINLSDFDKIQVAVSA